MKVIEPEPKDAFETILFRLTADPFFLMLTLGALGHQLHIDRLFLFGFWQCWLLVAAVQAISPRKLGGKYRVIRK